MKQVIAWQGWVSKDTIAVPWKRWVKVQDTGLSVSWHRTLYSMTSVVGNVLSDTLTAFHILSLCIPQSQAPHIPCTSPTEFQWRRKAAMPIREDVWEDKSHLSLWLLWLEKVWVSFIQWKIQVSLFSMLFNLPLIEYEIAYAKNILVIFLGYVIDLSWSPVTTIFH